MWIIDKNICADGNFGSMRSAQLKFLRKMINVENILHTCKLLLR